MSYKRYLELGGNINSTQDDLMADTASSPNMFGAEPSNPNPSKNTSIKKEGERLQSLAQSIGNKDVENIINSAVSRTETDSIDAYRQFVEEKVGQVTDEISKIDLGYVFSSFAINKSLDLSPFIRSKTPELKKFAALSQFRETAKMAVDEIASSKHSFSNDTNKIKSALDSKKVESNMAAIFEYLNMVKPVLFFSAYSNAKFGNVGQGGAGDLAMIHKSYESVKPNDAYPGRIDASNIDPVRTAKLINAALQMAQVLGAGQAVVYPFSPAKISSTNQTSGTGGGTTFLVELVNGKQTTISATKGGAQDLEAFISTSTDSKTFKEGGKMNKLKLVKMEAGGIMEGPSHEEGGIPIVSEEGSVIAEMEGEELILSTEDTDAMDTMARDFIETGQEDILREIGAYFVNARIKQEAINSSEDGIAGLDPNMMGMEDNMEMGDDMAMAGGMENDMMEEEMPMAKYGMKMKQMAKGGKGLYDNINAKRERIAKGSGEKMRKKGAKGAPSDKDFKDASKTAKMAKGGKMGKTEYYRMLNKI